MKIPTVMKAWQLATYNEDPSQAIDAMTLTTDVKVPEPDDHEVLLKVSHAALNPIDWKLFTGGFHENCPIANFPYVPGFDVAGTVVAVGKDAKASIGDVVCADIGLVESCRAAPPKNGPAGALAEYCAVDSALVVKVASAPDCVGVPLAGMTAYQALFTGQAQSFAGEPLGDAKEGSKVLILGAAGGVGSIAVQLAKAKGCFVATTASPSLMPDGKTTKLEFAKGLGADTVIDYTSQDWGNELAGQNYDIIFDCVGQQEDYDVRAPKVLKKDGLFVTVANFTPTNQSKNDVRYAVFLVSSNAKDLQTLVDMIAAGILRVPIDSTYTMGTVKEALKRSLSGKSVGKIIIEIGE